MTERIEQHQQQLEEKLAKRMAEFEQQLSEMKDNPHHESPKVEELAREFQKFKTFSVEMLSLLRQQISQLQAAVDQMETRDRSNCLLLKGIPEKQDENVFLTVAEVLRERLSITDINLQSFRACYRIGRSNEAATRSILVRFWDYRMRQTVWTNKTKFKGSPFSCSEFLIKARQLLFVEKRRTFGVRDCWTQDGTIVVKLPDGAKHKILHRSDLNDLMAACNKTDPAPSSTHQVSKERVRRAAARR